jgi:peptidoglycan-N-acetylglucosamine deacetylase
MTAEPPKWPGGARCAVAITFDVDSDSLIHVTRPEDSFRYVNAISWLRYDQVAIPNILELFRRFQLKQTFFFPAWCMQQYPQLVRAAQNDGHEIGLHGYLHEWPNRLTLDAEKALLELGLDVFQKVAGGRPAGWRTPWGAFSENTGDLLAAEGFLYDSSLMGGDLPYVLETNRGDLIELPIDWTMDDWPQYVNVGDLDFMMPIKAPEDAMKVFLAEFDAAWEASGLWIANWHPFVSGRPSRLRQIARAIEYIQSKGGIWFATLQEIAEHTRDARAKGGYQARVDKLPYFEGPVTYPAAARRP